MPRFRLWMIAVCFALGAPASGALERITIAAFEYPPIYQNAESKGLSGEIVIEAFKAAGIEAELRFYPVARMILNVADGKEVCGIGGSVLFEAPEIASEVRVSEVVQYVSQGFLYDSRKYPLGFRFESLEDLKAYRIGVLYSSGIMKFLEKEKLRLEPSTSHKSAALQLHTGKVDLWAIVDLTGLMYVRELFPKDAHFYKNTRPFNRGDVSLVCSKRRDPQQRYGEKFKKGLATIKRNGTYLRIMAKYYGSLASINKEAMTDDMRHKIP